MDTIAAANHGEAPIGDSGLSELSSPSSISRHSIENITRIDREFYKAAVKGNFNKFVDVQNIQCLLTPNKNTVLHVHLTATTTERIESVPKSIWTYKITEPVSEDFVQQILDKCGGLVLLPNAKGETPLHVAARYGHSTITKLLIQRAKSFPLDIESGTGVEKKLVRATNRENETALYEAVRYHHIEVVEILLETDPDHSNTVNNANETPLYLAAERKYKQIVHKISAKVESPAYEGPNDRAALHAAVINRDIEMARDLLKNENLGAAVKHVDKKGWVPLHFAVKLGNKRLAKLLLEQDENTAYMQDNEGRTALHIASYCGHWFIMQMIIRHYPDCSELVENKGWNALHYAVNGECYTAVARIMRSLSLSNLYNEKDIDGNTPLNHLANSRSSNRKLVFHNRVDKLPLNQKDQTALDVAYVNVEATDKLLTKQRGSGSIPWCKMNMRQTCSTWKKAE